MKPAALTLTLIAALSLGIQAQEATLQPFPASTAIAEGVSPASLERLDDLVTQLVEDEEVVGAELLVIKNGKSILHEAYGWRDRDAAVPMQTGSVFCVRSMTKPLIGTAALMLINEDLLELDDPVGKYLPAFAVEGYDTITIEHLLTHTSGLPMSHIASEDPRTLESVRAVAELGTEHPLEFTPGAAFEYSDQGTDTLTAVIEVVTGAPAEDFVTERLLEPLGMDSSACLLTKGHPLRSRTSSKYFGSPGHWNRYWSPDDEALFPVFLGSQGLYSTTADYALFLEMWMRSGRGRTMRFLRPRLTRKALKPGPFPMEGGTGFPDTSAEYGMLMQVWPTAEGKDLIAFGHNGSDGTYAWAFPDQKALVMYFTQSRNSPTGLRLEEVLSEMFLGAPYDPNQDAPPFEDYLGYYFEGEGDLYRAIVREGDHLGLEIMGKAIAILTYAGDDRWKMRDRPSTVLEFQRSEDGIVTGYRIGDHEEFRFEPAADLPTGDEIAQRVVGAHQIHRLKELGPLSMSLDLEIPKVGISGEVEALYAWPNRYRIESLAGEEVENIAFNGEVVTYFTRMGGLETLEGSRRELAMRDSMLVRLGDWRDVYEGLHVVQRFERQGEEILVVRAGASDTHVPTFYVHGPTGRVLAEDKMVEAPMMGRIGQHIEYKDYRDVSGMTLPYEIEIELANPMIGSIVSRVQDVSFGGEASDAAFVLAE